MLYLIKLLNNMDIPMKNNEKDNNLNKIVNDQVNEDFKKDSFKTNWTWYLFLLSCIIIVIGTTISLIIFYTLLNGSITKDNLQWKLSTIICNILGLIIIAIFAYFEFKNFKVQKFHTQFKWFKFIISSLFLYSSIIIITCIILIVVPDGYIKVYLWAPILNLVISMIFSLIAVGLYRYGRFHIDKDIYMRRHGKQIKDEISAKQKHIDSINKINQLSDEEFEKMKQGINDNDSIDLIGVKPTSGITDKKFDEE